MATAEGEANIQGQINTDSGTKALFQVFQWLLNHLPK